MTPECFIFIEIVILFFFLLFSSSFSLSSLSFSFSFLLLLLFLLYKHIYTDVQADAVDRQTNIHVISAILSTRGIQENKYTIDFNKITIIKRRNEYKELNFPFVIFRKEVPRHRLQKTWSNADVPERRETIDSRTVFPAAKLPCVEVHKSPNTI